MLPTESTWHCIYWAMVRAPLRQIERHWISRARLCVPFPLAEPIPAHPKSSTQQPLSELHIESRSQVQVAGCQALTHMAPKVCKHRLQFELVYFLDNPALFQWPLSRWITSSGLRLPIRDTLVVLVSLTLASLVSDIRQVCRFHILYLKTHLLLSTSNYIALFRKTAPELHKLNCTDYINKTTELLQTELNSAALNWTVSNCTHSLSLHYT